MIKTQKFPGSFVSVQCRQDPGFTGLISNDLEIGELLAFPDPLSSSKSAFAMLCYLSLPTHQKL